MKKVINVLAAALMTLSCHNMEKVSTVNVTFMGKAPSCSVKSAAWDDDSTVQHLDLYIFRKRDGVLLERLSCTGNAPISANIPMGQEISWHMIANAPEGMLPLETSLSGFLNTVILLEDGPVMQTCGNAVFTEDGITVTGELSRYACKVSIGSINVLWADAQPCTLEKIVLMSAPGACTVGGNLPGEEYIFNKGKLDEVLPETLYTAAGSTLYCMPNPSDGDSYGLPWSPRRTRVAICLKMRGEDNWFPVDLPSLERNHHYMVDNIVIKGPGTTGPDMKIERTSLDFCVQIHEWMESDVTAVFNP